MNYLKTLFNNISVNSTKNKERKNNFLYVGIDSDIREIVYNSNNNFFKNVINIIKKEINKETFEYLNYFDSGDYIYLSKKDYLHIKELIDKIDTKILINDTKNFYKIIHNILLNKVIEIKNYLFYLIKEIVDNNTKLEKGDKIDGIKIILNFNLNNSGVLIDKALKFQLYNIIENNEKIEIVKKYFGISENKTIEKNKFFGLLMQNYIKKIKMEILF